MFLGLEKVVGLPLLARVYPYTWALLFAPRSKPRAKIIAAVSSSSSSSRKSLKAKKLPLGYSGWKKRRRVHKAHALPSMKSNKFMQFVNKNRTHTKNFTAKMCR